MSRYTQEPLHFAQQVDGRYRLTAPLVWHIGHIGGPEYVVGAGFVFDVSIPWFARWAFNPHAREYFKAAALHDSMLLEGFDRVTAGAAFHEGLRAEGVTMWRRFVMWLAVSLWKYK